MRKIKCPVCENINIKQIRNLIKCKKYALMHCTDCGLKFLLSNSYEELDNDIYWDEINKKIYSMPEVLKEFEKKYNKYLDVIKCSVPPNNKLLDVGCGNGIFVMHSIKKKFDAIGIEPSKIAVELCEKKYGITLFNGYLKINSNLPKDYGVISAWDVIEHVANPKIFLEICHAHLEKGGMLILETPDESCSIRKFINLIDRVKNMFGLQSNSTIYYPSHRYYFTHKSITILLNSSGFSNVRIFKEHSIYSKSKAKYKLYRKYTMIQMIKYEIIFFFLKLPFFSNKQVIVCTKS